MAKRYARINWQNRPSVATPISATNLNKMDKGIDDIDNAIEEIYNKRVNNVVTTNPDTFLAGPVGKTLQDQIDVLNNNLVTLKLPLTVITTQEELDTFLGNVHTNVADATWYRRLFNINVTGLTLGGGTYYLEGCRVNTTYGWQKITLFASSGAIVKYRSKTSSGWNTWTEK